MTSVADGAADWDDMKMASVAVSLFGKKEPKAPPTVSAVGKWRAAGKNAGRIQSIFAAISGSASGDAESAEDAAPVVVGAEG